MHQEDHVGGRASLRSRIGATSVRTRSVIAATGILVVGVTATGVAATGSPILEGKRNGTAVAETQIISNVNASNAPTGGFSTRQSNLSSTGGGAIYGCRSTAGGTAATPPTNPCIRANNLSNGFAFEFNARDGLSAGLITVGNGGDTKKPFTTNATGVATGLNADRVDGLNASEIAAGAVQTARAKTGLDADTVDGVDSAELATRWALVNESGVIEQQTGGFSLVNCYQANNNCYIDAGSDVRNKGLDAEVSVANTDGSAILSGETGTAACGATTVNCAPPGTETNNVIVVAPRESDGSAFGAGASPTPAEAARFYVYVHGATGR